MFALLVGPVEVAGHDLEDLEALGVAAVEGEEVEEVVCDDLPRLVSDDIKRGYWRITCQRCLLASSSSDTEAPWSSDRSAQWPHASTCQSGGSSP